MDTVLARSFGVRPENKIAMKCPSWPDTPLHQYFGAQKSNQKKSDFAISSLGYVRLYEYCCPCERNNAPVQDSESGSSFVHLEERLRGDGPFILYRRPTQRRVGPDLSERAREKRLLKYYKYFQGFQRKFQVSRQFQQAYHKPENRAQVKKIINCYKPKRTASEQSSRKALSGKQNNSVPVSNSPSRSGHESCPSTDENNRSVDDLTLSVNECSRSLDDNRVSEIKLKSFATEKNEKKKNTKVNVNKTQTSIKKELAEMAAVFACMDTNMNIFLKRVDRGTLKTPTLATIEEVTNDCDYSESEQSSESAVCSTPRVSINTDPPKRDQAPETLRSPSTSLNKAQTQIRGILKHYKTPTFSKETLKEADASEKTSKPNVENEISSSAVMDNQSRASQKPKEKKFRRTRRKSASVRTADDDIDFAGGLRVTQNARLKKEVLPRARRFRPVLKRTNGDTSPRSLSGASSLEEIDQNEAAPESPEIVDSPPLSEHEETSVPETPAEEPPAPLKITRTSPKQPKRTKVTTKLPPGMRIRFRGWDYGTSLSGHTSLKVPEDKDLCLQQLERADKLCWGKYSMSPEEMSGPSLGKCQAETPNAYLQRQNIGQIFEHLARSLIVGQSDRPLDGLQALAHDLTTQHANRQDMQRDLQDMRGKPKPSACSRYADTSLNQALSKLVSKPRLRVGSALRGIATPMLGSLLESAAPDDSVSNMSHE